MVSDVPLTEDILGEKPKFIFNFYEWLSTQGKQIFERESALADEANTIYTVPDNKTLFLTSFTLSCFENHSIVGTAKALIYIDDQNRPIGAVGLDSTGGIETNSVSNSFPFPIKIEEKSKIIVLAEAEIGAEAVITGFLVDKKILF